jgi:hypothetical protein
MAGISTPVRQRRGPEGNFFGSVEKVSLLCHCDSVNKKSFTWQQVIDSPKVIARTHFDHEQNCRSFYSSRCE